jgi:hypothetical protein
VPTNFDALAAFRYHIMVLWMRTLTRRSQKDRTNGPRPRGRVFARNATLVAPPMDMAGSNLQPQC